jgi:hypothetical protein
MAEKRYCCLHHHNNISYHPTGTKDSFYTSKVAKVRSWQRTSMILTVSEVCVYDRQYQAQADVRKILFYLHEVFHTEQCSSWHIPEILPLCWTPMNQGRLWMSFQRNLQIHVHMCLCKHGHHLPLHQNVKDNNLLLTNTTSTHGGMLCPKSHCIFHCFTVHFDLLNFLTPTYALSHKTMY